MELSGCCKMRKIIILVVIFVTLVSCLGYHSACNSCQKKFLSKGRPFAEQVTKKNTVYIIRNDFDLKGGKVDIPAGCVLKLAGGTVTNGSINLNNTRLEGVRGFQNVVLKGRCANSELSSDLFVLDKTGTTDNSLDVQSMFNIGVDTIKFSKGTYSFSNIKVGNAIVYANGSTFVSTLVSDKYAVINNIFVANNTDYFKLYDATIQGYKDGSSNIKQVVLSPIDCSNVKNVEIKECRFRELRYSCNKAYAGGLYDYRGISLSCHGCKNVLIENCEFYDMKPSEWIWVAPNPSGSWNDVETVCIRNNYFHNPKDDFERSNTPVNVFSKKVIFERNLLEYQKYAGSAFNLQCRNVIVRDNIVRNSYFKSIVDVCEYGDFCNDFVSVCNNNFSAYNSQAVVANSKELIVKDNNFDGLSAVLAYATCYDPSKKHAACVDYATIIAKPNQKVVIDGNMFNCNLIDTSWTINGTMVHGGYCSGITIQSIACISDSIFVRNNKLFIREVKASNLGNNFTHQPIYVRNARNICINDNYIDSDVSAIGSKYKGAIYILVYNRDRGSDAKLKEMESVNILNNRYNITSDDRILYTTRISGYSGNTSDWTIKNANISGNKLINSSKKDQIYTTGGQIEKLAVGTSEIDIANSPAIIKKVVRTDSSK